MVMANNLYPKSSPYFLTNIVNNKYLDVMVNRYIPELPADDEIVIKPKYQYRPDLMAYDLYGDSKLWWVFAQRNPNKLPDPYFDFVAGLVIYVPKQSTLTQYLGL